MHVGRITPREAEKVIKTTGIWEWFQDGDTEPGGWSAPEERCLYLGVFDPDLVGCYAFEAHGSIHAHVHACLTDACRGQKALESAQLGTDWIRNNTSIRRLTAPVLACNKKAALFVRMLGYVPYGVNPCASIHQGLPCDVVMFGITL